MQRADNTRRWDTRHKDTSRAHRLSRRRTGDAWAPALPRCAVVSCARSLASAVWIAASAWRTAIVKLLDVNGVGQMSRMRVGLVENTKGKWKGKCGNDSVYFLNTTLWPRYPRIASPSFGLFAASTNLLTFLLMPSPACAGPLCAFSPRVLALHAVHAADGRISILPAILALSRSPSLVL